jgi:hypothetical protein
MFKEETKLFYYERYAVDIILGGLWNKRKNTTLNFKERALCSGRRGTQVQLYLE